MCDHDIKDIKNTKDGSELAHGEVHTKAHQKWGRRSFLRGLGITGGMGLMLGKFPVNALSTSPLSALVDGGDSDRILVMIRLSGGNDGLNTLIPLYDYDAYLSSRPRLAKSESDNISLNNELALNSNLQSLMPLWNEGSMKIVNGVGYDNHNLSHFRSTDILASASDANETIESGFLGRFLDDCFPDFLTDPPENPPAIQVGAAGSILFRGGASTVEDYALSVANPQQLLDIAQTGMLYEVENLPECTYGEQLGFIRSVANSTIRYAEIINETYSAAQNDVAYTTPLGQQLALIARLIKGGLKTQFYVVTLGGFDTHADQENTHDNLMSTLASAVDNFFKDLKFAGRDNSVLAMTFSEFGRRLQENASRGTDHGTASPTMLFGPGLNGNGILGDNPDLNDLDNAGNLKFNTDFRQIYATVLENWLCVDPGKVNELLFDNFNRLDLGLTCQIVSTTSLNDGFAVKHEARYDDQGKAYIYYELLRPQYVKVDIFNISGQHIQSLQSGIQSIGSYSLPVNLNRQFSLTSFVYRISINGEAFSRVFPLLRS